MAVMKMANMMDREKERYFYNLQSIKNETDPSIRQSYYSKTKCTTEVSHKVNGMRISKMPCMHCDFTKVNLTVNTCT